MKRRKKYSQNIPTVICPSCGRKGELKEWRWGYSKGWLPNYWYIDHGWTKSGYTGQPVEDICKLKERPPSIATARAKE